VKRIRLATLSVAVLVCPALGSAQDLLAEAEWYTEAKDLGGALISRVECSYASNDSAVDHIDIPAESITLEITFAQDGNYVPIVRAAGLPDSLSVLQLSLRGANLVRADQVSEVEILGSGVG
jgi:hypothetical protein